MGGVRLEVLLENRQKKIQISRRRLLASVRKILIGLGWKRVALSLVLVSDPEIRRLHSRFLGKDRPTDVLAFGQMEGKVFPRAGIPFLGDVVVSVETARRVGPQWGQRWDEELLLYICHGILHLMGYRDSRSREKAQMDKKQKKILRKVLGEGWQSKKRKPLF